MHSSLSFAKGAPFTIAAATANWTLHLHILPGYPRIPFIDAAVAEVVVLTVVALDNACNLLQSTTVA